jgi:hypothetical protein
LDDSAPHIEEWCVGNCAKAHPDGAGISRYTLVTLPDVE